MVNKAPHLTKECSGCEQQKHAVQTCPTRNLKHSHSRSRTIPSQYYQNARLSMCLLYGHQCVLHHICITLASCWHLLTRGISASSTNTSHHNTKASHTSNGQSMPVGCPRWRTISGDTKIIKQSPKQAARMASGIAKR